MRIAIAGGTGTVGRHLVRQVAAAGHEATVLARSQGVDLVTGKGLDLAGVDAVIDASGPRAASAAKSTALFTAVTTNLLAAERAVGVSHHLALSIVGAAHADQGYYAGKAAQERTVSQGDVPWTVLRTTQFFEFAEQNAVSAGPWLLMPRLRCQPVAAATVAERLVELVEAGPSGDAADLAGPDELCMADVLRACQERRPHRRRVIEFPLPGGFGRVLRDGTILPGPDAMLRGPNLAEWVASQ